MIYNCSYVVRAFYDYWLIDTLLAAPLWGPIANIFLPLFLDYIPISLILGYHYRNFKPAIIQDHAEDYDLESPSGNNSTIDTHTTTEMLVKIPESSSLSSSLATNGLDQLLPYHNR